jgi:hypothetical protein
MRKGQKALRGIEKSAMIETWKGKCVRVLKEQRGEVGGPVDKKVL